MEFTRQEKERYQNRWAFVVGTLESTIKQATKAIKSLDYRLNMDTRKEYVFIEMAGPIPTTIEVDITGASGLGIIEAVVKGVK